MQLILELKLVTWCSDTPLHYFVDAVKIGVGKINVNSDLRYTFSCDLEKVLKENPAYLHY